MAEQTFLELQQNVLFRVHGTSDTTSANVSSTLLGRVKYAINHALTVALGKIRTTHTKRRGTITLIAAQADYDLPARCTGIINDTMYSSITPDRAIRLVSQQEWTRLGGQADTDTGEPILFSEYKFNTSTKRMAITLHPTPGAAEVTASGVLTFEYNESPAEMTASGDIPPLPEHLHDGLMHGAIVLGFAEYMDRDVLTVHVQAWNDYLKLLARNSAQVVGARSMFRARGQTSRTPFLNTRWPLT